MKFVVDASVAIKWVLDEADTADAVAILRTELLAPDLPLSECGNTLWKYVQRGQLTAQSALEKLGLIIAYPVLLVTSKSLARRALEMAIELAHPAYDTLYLAAAEREAVRVVTADARLLKTVANSPHRNLVISLRDAAAN